MAPSSPSADVAPSSPPADVAPRSPPADTAPPRPPADVAPRSPPAHTAPRRPLGRCSFLFLLAVSSDLLGLGLILVGVFVNLELAGRSFGEFLIYSGGILLFFSLLWWLAWYSLNLEVSLEELMKEPPVSPVRRNLVLLARKVSESFSKRSRRKAGGHRGPAGTSSLELSAAPSGEGRVDRLV